MKIRINNHQLKILCERFHIVNNQLIEKNDIICESGMKEYLVKLIFGGTYAKIRIFSYSQSSAMQIVSKLFKGAIVTADVKTL